MNKQEYTEGVCSDGAAILKDGVPMTISEVLSGLRDAARVKELEDALNEIAFLACRRLTFPADNVVLNCIQRGAEIKCCGCVAKLALDGKWVDDGGNPNRKREGEG